MPQKLDNRDDVRSLQWEMGEGARNARYAKREQILADAKKARKETKEYTREGQEDPDARNWRKSYYRGDQRMPPGDPSIYAPGDQQLKDLYEGSGKYYGFGKTALGGTQSNSAPKEDRYRRGMNIKK